MECPIFAASQGLAGDDSAHCQHPERCTVAAWLACASRTPARARSAVDALARIVVCARALVEQGSAIREEVLATAIHAAVAAERPSIQRGALLSSWVEQIVDRVVRRERRQHAVDGSAWEDLAVVAVATARPSCRRHGISLDVAEDLAQEAMLRMLVAADRGISVAHLRAWCWRCFTSMAGDAARGHGPLGSGRERTAGVDFDQNEQERLASPEEEAAKREMAEIAAALVDRLLPPPYREIARLQNLDGWSRAEITAWLSRWRAVGHEAGRKLLRDIHEMLRWLGEGKRPRDRWPDRYEPTKNPWFGAPPPTRRSPSPGRMGGAAPKPDRTRDRPAELGGAAEPNPQRSAGSSSVQPGPRGPETSRDADADAKRLCVRGWASARPPKPQE